VDALERAQLDAVVEDLERHRPALILVDRRVRHPYYGSHPLDFLAFLRRDPRFEAIWRDYRWTDRSFLGFAVARRRTESQPGPRSRPPGGRGDGDPPLR
jgi:hypothetical protein